MIQLVLAGFTALTLSPRGVPAQNPEPLLVTTAWLAEHLNDRGLVIFQIGDANTRGLYDAGHIPGAQFLNPFVDLSTPRVEGALFLELPKVEVLDSVMEARGVGDASRIVIYSAQRYFAPTSRVFFTLEYRGLAGRVSILDGGLEAWKAEGRATSTEEPSPTPAAFTPKPRADLVVDAGFVSRSLTDRSVRIVDARDTSFYNGRETNQGRNGHIPGAANIPFQTIMDSSGKFRSPVLLRAQFAAQGVQEGQTVVSYCHIGQQASLVWFAARLLGYNARLYDGSFQDWARRTELPVEGKRPE